MQRKGKKLFTWCLLTCFVITLMLSSTMVFAQSTLTTRLGGSDRYKTAVAISQNGWEKSSYAVLARGDDFADALCAGPLAKKYDAPILLSLGDELNKDTLDELKRLEVEHVIIVGGTGALSSKIEEELESEGINDIKRIYGANRYETSVKIAEEIGESDEVVLAVGSIFADALSISSVASKFGMPIILTLTDDLPLIAVEYIEKSNIQKTYIVGGLGAVSQNIEDSVPNPVRLGGKDRYETNALIMTEFADVLNFDKIYVAVGDDPNGLAFADALAGSALAAKTSSPIVLIYNKIAKVTEDFIKSKVSLGSKFIALGGDAVVPDAIIDTMKSYKNQANVSKIYDEAGTYGTEDVETISGNVIISARDVTLQNVIIKGDLLLAEEIGDGNVTLKNVTVEGSTFVNGGGPNSIIMYNFNGQNVIVDVPGGTSVRLVAQGSTIVASVTMNTDGKLEESELTGAGFTAVEIPEGATVILRGDFDSVNVEAPGAKINAENGTVTILNVTENASNADIHIAETASVTALTASAPVGVTGKGTITTANINSDGVSIEQTPTVTIVDENVESADVGGTTMPGGTDTTTPPEEPSIELNITGLTANGEALSGTGTSAEPYVLAADPAVEGYILQFAADSISNLELGDGIGLLLIDSTLEQAQMDYIIALYAAKPEPYNQYLAGALEGKNAFAVIKSGEGKTLVLYDGAKLAGESPNAELGMLIPGNFPPATYTLKGTVGSQTFTFVLEIKNP